MAYIKRGFCRNPHIHPCNERKKYTHKNNIVVIFTTLYFQLSDIEITRANQKREQNKS